MAMIIGKGPYATDDDVYDLVNVLDHENTLHPTRLVVKVLPQRQIVAKAAQSDVYSLERNSTIVVVAFKQKLCPP